MQGTTAVLLLCVSTFAQTPIVVKEQLQSTRLVWVVGVERPVELRIDYQAASWPATLDVKRATESAVALGNGGWATLHSGVELRFGERKLPAGIWYLALHRAANASWSLAILDPTKIRQQGVLPSDVRDVKPSLLVPLKFTREHDEQPTLQMGMSAAEDQGAVDLELRWGTVRWLTTLQTEVTLGAPKPPEFRALDESRAIATDSGLRYEVLRSGIGSRPTANDKVRTHYVGWLTDGKKFDSSIDRKQPTAFPVSAVIKGWQESLVLMRPGSVFLIEIPPDLGYGEAGTGATIPPNSTLVFWVELLAVE